MWSRAHSACVSCDSTQFKHYAHGLCSSCYAKEYKKNPEKKARIDQQKADWFMRYHAENLEKARIAREETHFDSQRSTVLARDGNKCTKCPSLENLIVHHIDGNGRGSENPNNDLDNLITLCRSCHMNEHREELMEVRKANGYRRSSPKTWKQWNESTIFLLVGLSGDIEVTHVSPDRSPCIDLESLGQVCRA